MAPKMSMYNNDEAAKQAEEELNKLLEAQDAGAKDESKDPSNNQRNNENNDDLDDEEDEDEEADDDKSKEDLGDDTAKSDDKDDLDEDGDGLSDDDKSKLDDDDDSEQPKKREKDGDKLIPKWQAKAEIKRIEKELKESMEARLKEEVERISGLKKDTEDKELPEVQEFVKKFGLKENGPEFIKEFGALIAKQQGLDELKHKQEEQQREALRIQAENEGFEKDWNQTQASELPKYFPGVSEKEIAHIKKKVHELAYSERYAHYSLGDIIRLNKSKILGEKKKSFESHKPLGKQSGMKSFDLDNPNSIPWSELSPQEFEKVSEALAARSPSSTRITRKSGIKNK